MSTGRGETFSESGYRILLTGGRERRLRGGSTGWRLEISAIASRWVKDCGSYASIGDPAIEFIMR